MSREEHQSRKVDDVMGSNKEKMGSSVMFSTFRMGSKLMVSSIEKGVWAGVAIQL